MQGRREQPGEKAAKSPKVISIGNIEAGGTGKTPMTLELASRLNDSGHSVAVVTRGYGGRAARTGRPVVVEPAGSPAGGEGGPAGISVAGFEDDITHTGSQASEIAGDEACLYAARGIPVVIDADRRRGIAKAAERFSPTHVLLDDAFQRLDADPDCVILLLDAERPFGNGRLLPMGTLREEPAAAALADVVIFTRAEADSSAASEVPFIDDKKIFYSRHVPAGIFERDGTRADASDLRDSETVIFSGIARPSSFERSAVEAGLDPYLSVRFADHHRYGADDVRAITSFAHEGTVFVTTEKDMGKVNRIFPEDRRLCELRIRLEIERVGELLEAIV